MPVRELVQAVVRVLVTLTARTIATRGAKGNAPAPATPIAAGRAETLVIQDANTDADSSAEGTVWVRFSITRDDTRKLKRKEST